MFKKEPIDTTMPHGWILYEIDRDLRVGYFGAVALRYKTAERPQAWCALNHWMEETEPTIEKAIAAIRSKIIEGKDIQED